MCVSNKVTHFKTGVVNLSYNWIDRAAAGEPYTSHAAGHFIIWRRDEEWAHDRGPEIGSGKCFNNKEFI